MIRLATVFSGIGAIEHALDRMGIEHKIVFACDNGDVDVLSKKIEGNMDQILDEIEYLHCCINSIDLSDNDNYEKQLLDMFDAIEKDYKDIELIINSQDIDKYRNIIFDILNKLIITPNLKNRKKIYKGFLDKLKSKSSLTQKKLVMYEIILKITKDFIKDNNIDDLGKNNIKFSSSLNINWSDINKDLKVLYEVLENTNGKKILRMVHNLSQRIGQLYGKINSLNHINNIKKTNSFIEKKKYVDSLYKDHEKRNKVKISYMANYDCSEENYHWDASFLDGTQYRNQVDLFVGGSPCQSFSQVGKQRGLSDTRGTLFYEYARLIDEIRPKVFIYENVKAVLSNDCGNTWKKMKEVFEDLGYNVYYENNGKPSILNAKDYGIPQNRERLFVIGFRSDLSLNQNFQFPQPTLLKKKMSNFLMNDAPGNYFLPKKGVNFVNKEKNLNKKFTQIDGEIALCQKKNQEFNWHGDFVFQSEEDAIKNDIPNLEKYFLAETVEKHILPNGKIYFSNNIQEFFSDSVIHGRIRKLTPRECLRLMGFSDEWNIVVGDTAMYQQAGNSIVVDVLIQIMNEILNVYPNLIQQDN